MIIIVQARIGYVDDYSWYILNILYLLIGISNSITPSYHHISYIQHSDFS